MEHIFFLIYIGVAFLLMFLYEKIYPYEEDDSSDYSSRDQKRMYNSMLVMGVVFWPILLLAYIIRWAMDFVECTRKKKGE